MLDWFFGMGILFKVHRSYRWVVAVCDEDLVGRKLKDGVQQIDLTSDFFRGEKLEGDELRESVVDCLREDATFNVVGAESVDFFKELNIIDDSGIGKIDGVPFALVLL